VNTDVKINNFMEGLNKGGYYSNIINNAVNNNNKKVLNASSNI
jgi:hypothetical protein